MIDENKLHAWLCLKAAPDVGLKTAYRIVDAYGSPETFVGNAGHAIYSSPDVSAVAKQHLLAALPHPRFTQILRLMEHYEIRFTTLTDPDYPADLLNIYTPPLILYYRGMLAQALEKTRLGVVGTRKPSAYGKEMTRKLLQPVAELGVCIVSGLAMGIDTVSHLTALDSGALTIAALAGGLEEIYPPINRELAKRIVAQGALVSEYDPGSKMEQWNFPARNRIISALSQASFIVEGAISSGALLTAKFAMEQNRDLLALPGNITSHNAEGPNYLIKTGAAIVTCAEDILQTLGLDAAAAPQLDLFPELSDTETEIYAYYREEQREISFDELMVKTGYSFGKLSIALLNLELKGLLAKSGGSAYIIR
ncbi:MAG: DNA-protecting protein DprA [Candidatus Cloacimonetes bacterium HGW-Cloacimonetes-1]|jgi:DNA processing protein|nr:MAG: DNA-protecting protein DprA [Candidatus Cloacimonetes bacterium HGW-Cloacimonetes-1]